MFLMLLLLILLLLFLLSLSLYFLVDFGIAFTVMKSQDVNSGTDDFEEPSVTRVTLTCFMSSGNTTLSIQVLKSLSIKLVEF